MYFQLLFCLFCLPRRSYTLLYCRMIHARGCGTAKLQQVHSRAKGDGGRARFGKLCFNKKDLEARVLIKGAVQRVELEKSNILRRPHKSAGGEKLGVW
jgi:hypothetical protein